MKDNQLALVSFEQAWRLREAGFDWETIDFWYVDYDRHKKFEDMISVENLLTTSNHYRVWNNGHDSHTSAPSVALALKWMRDVKNKSFFEMCKIRQEWCLKLNSESRFLRFPTYEEAESALLDELLKTVCINN